MSLGKAIEKGIPILGMKWISNLNEKYFEEITKGNTKIPLSKERLKILREIGSIITKKFNRDFGNLLKIANKDVIKLLNLIVSNFPSFEDSSFYKGKKIFFYKRAQLLISDIYQLFEGKGYGAFKNVNQLTASADYKLPQVLRKLGILEYSKELAEKIDKKIHISKGSEEEVEIRASTILANELIKQKLKEKIPEVDSIHINDHLWLLSQNKSPNDKPYHLTRTTAY